MVTGFVLAGGRSTRMGRDKAFLRVGRRTLVEHVAQRLRPSVTRLTVIGSAANAERLRAIAAPGEPVLEDVRPERGPLMGVYTGLMAAADPVAVFVPCDMPWVEPELVARLVAACAAGAAAAASVVPDDGWHPFPLAVRTVAARAAGALLDADRGAMRGFLDAVDARVLTIEESWLRRSFLNLNTPADLAALERDALAPGR